MSVHVTRKRPNRALSQADRIPSTIDCLPTDVVEVGQPRTYALTHDDRMDGSGNRWSSIAAIGYYERRCFILASGHGVMPWNDDGIVRWGSQMNVAIDIHDDGSVLGGILRRGAFGGRGDVDYSVVEVAPTASISTIHAAADRAAPYPVRTSPLVQGEPVYCWSASWCRGLWPGVLGEGVVQSAVLTEVLLRVEDRSLASYSRAISVVKQPAAKHEFAMLGDSGALVFDAKRHVIGQLVGGKNEFTYILPITVGVRLVTTA